MRSVQEKTTQYSSRSWSYDYSWRRIKRIPRFINPYFYHRVTIFIFFVPGHNFDFINPIRQIKAFVKFTDISIKNTYFTSVYIKFSKFNWINASNLPFNYDFI